MVRPPAVAIREHLVNVFQNATFRFLGQEGAIFLQRCFEKKSPRKIKTKLIRSSSLSTSMGNDEGKVVLRKYF